VVAGGADVALGDTQRRRGGDGRKLPRSRAFDFGVCSPMSSVASLTIAHALGGSAATSMGVGFTPRICRFSHKSNPQDLTISRESPEADTGVMVGVGASVGVRVGVSVCGRVEVDGGVRVGEGVSVG
jgi:hypothetical protein